MLVRTKRHILNFNHQIKSHWAKSHVGSIETGIKKCNSNTHMYIHFNYIKRRCSKSLFFVFAHYIIIMNTRFNMNHISLLNSNDETFNMSLNITFLFLYLILKLLYKILLYSDNCNLLLITTKYLNVKLRDSH